MSLRRQFSKVARARDRLFLRKRLKAVRGVVASLPEGRELLRQARGLNVSIHIVRKFSDDPDGLMKGAAAYYAYEDGDGKQKIELLASSSNVQIVRYLVHELRHMQQAERLGMFPRDLPWPNMRETMLMQRVMEADAQVFTYVFCARLHEAGRPEYLQSCRDDLPHAALARLDSARGGEQDFRRALFKCYQEKETYRYDDDLREEVSLEMERSPADFAHKKVELRSIFNFRTRMSDLRDMTAIDGRSYLSGMTRVELQETVFATMRKRNSRFIEKFNAFMEKQAVPPRRKPVNDNRGEAHVKDILRKPRKYMKKIP